MVTWQLSQNEINQLQTILEGEFRRKSDVLMHATDEQRREAATSRQLEIKRLLKSLEQAAEEKADVLCYCDTNYEFTTKTMSIAYRVGGDTVVTRLLVEDMPPPPDEYHGIFAVLQELKQRKTQGFVLVLTDAARCALALQTGLKYKVPRHTDNQAPRKKDFKGMYQPVINLIKELDAAGCHVEFRYKNRVFINDVLGLK